MLLGCFAGAVELILPLAVVFYAIMNLYLGGHEPVRVLYPIFHLHPGRCCPDGSAYLASASISIL